VIALQHTIRQLYGEAIARDLGADFAFDTTGRHCFDSVGESGKFWHTYSGTGPACDQSLR
jgi:hypothetical protein